MGVSKSRKLAVAIIVTMLSACQTAPKIGEGVITMSNMQSRAYDKYLKWEKEQQGTTAFAISRQKAVYGYYAASGYDGYNRALDGAITECEFDDCKIYAINGTVVWKNAEEPSGELKIGKGAINLPKLTMDLYRKYQDIRPANQHSVFVISSSGLSANFKWDKDLESAKIQATKGCNASSASKGHPQDCAIYDIDGKVVWEFDE